LCKNSSQKLHKVAMEADWTAGSLHIFRAIDKFFNLITDKDWPIENHDRINNASLGEIVLWWTAGLRLEDGTGKHSRRPAPVKDKILNSTWTYSNKLAKWKHRYADSKQPKSCMYKPESVESMSGLYQMIQVCNCKMIDVARWTLSYLPSVSPSKVEGLDLLLFIERPYLSLISMY